MPSPKFAPPVRSPYGSDGPAGLPTHPWVHLTPIGNLDTVLARGLDCVEVADGATRNYNTRPGVIYLTEPDAALRWAREIANRFGQPTTFAVFAVTLQDAPFGAWRGHSKTARGLQVVIEHWNIPVSALIHLYNLDANPRAGAQHVF